MAEPMRKNVVGLRKNFHWIQKKSSEKQTVDQDCEERNHDVMDDAEAAL